MNIIPLALIDMVAVLIFMFHYGGEKTEDTIWICVAIAIVLVIIVFNFIRYGLKNGGIGKFGRVGFQCIRCILDCFSHCSKQSETKTKAKK